ncbi:MAG: hypothetical protein LBK61_07545 [Spirochaetaceae bacterium]|jgi:hypothetical protein|nr:hypothetical protein [Spirochaetaceae bacterium]
MERTGMTETDKTPSPETVWAILMELSAKMDRFAVEAAERQREADARQKEADERQKEADARRQKEAEERQKEAAERQKEAVERQKKVDKEYEELRRLHAETEKVARNNGKQLGELNNRFGQVTEHMVVPSLVNEFRRLGFDFNKAGRNIKFDNPGHNLFMEVDAFLENGDKVMAVETKVKPSVDDVAHHVERMVKLRRYANIQGDSRKYLGAIAGVVIEDTIRARILANGFYVVEPSGKTFSIMAPEGKYHPREW